MDLPVLVITRTTTFPILRRKASWATISNQPRPSRNLYIDHTEESHYVGQGLCKSRTLSTATIGQSHKYICYMTASATQAVSPASSVLVRRFLVAKDAACWD